jgi:hypothetical protein
MKSINSESKFDFSEEMQNSHIQIFNNKLFLISLGRKKLENISILDCTQKETNSTNYFNDLKKWFLSQSKDSDLMLKVDKKIIYCDSHIIEMVDPVFFNNHILRGIVNEDGVRVVEFHNTTFSCLFTFIEFLYSSSLSFDFNVWNEKRLNNMNQFLIDHKIDYLSDFFHDSVNFENLMEHNSKMNIKRKINDFMTAEDIQNKRGILHFQFPNEKNKKLNCHIGLLKHRSTYFNKLLQSGYEEIKTNVIKIEDENVSSDHFKIILEYFYTDMFTEVSTGDVLQLFYICKVFEIDKMNGILRTFIKKGLEKDNVFDVFRFSESMGDEYILNICVNYIRDNFDLNLLSEKLNDDQKLFNNLKNYF